MPDKRRNSSWRNWVINGCFLASGIMVGAKCGPGGAGEAPTEDPTSQVVASADDTTVDSLMSEAKSNDDSGDTLNPVTPQTNDGAAELAVVPETSDAPNDGEPTKGDSQTGGAVKAEEADTAMDGDYANQTEASSTGNVAAKKPSDINSGVLSKEDMVVRKRPINTDQADSVKSDRQTLTDAVAAQEPTLKSKSADPVQKNMRQTDKQNVAKDDPISRDTAQAADRKGETIPASASPAKQQRKVMGAKTVVAKPAQLKQDDGTGKKSTFKLERIPPGVVEVIHVRKATQPESVRPVSTTQKQKPAVKKLDELERLQQSLRNLKR